MSFEEYPGNKYELKEECDYYRDMRNLAAVTLADASDDKDKTVLQMNYKLYSDKFIECTQKLEAEQKEKQEQEEKSRKASAAETVKHARLLANDDIIQNASKFGESTSPKDYFDKFYEYDYDNKDILLRDATPFELYVYELVKVILKDVYYTEDMIDFENKRNNPILNMHALELEEHYIFDLGQKGDEKTARMLEKALKAHIGPVWDMLDMEQRDKLWAVYKTGKIRNPEQASAAMKEMGLKVESMKTDKGDVIYPVKVETETDVKGYNGTEYPDFSQGWSACCVYTAEKDVKKGDVLTLEMYDEDPECKSCKECNGKQRDDCVISGVRKRRKD